MDEVIMPRWKAVLFGIGQAVSAIAAATCFIRFLLYLEIIDSVGSNAAILIFWCLVRLDTLEQQKVEVKNKHEN